MTRSLLNNLFVVVGCVLSSGEIVAVDKKPEFVRGAEFRRTWNSPIRASFERTPLRSVMQQLCSTAKLAWVVDRRLDPDQLVSCNLPAAPLSELLPQILEPIQADAVIVGDTVIVGPQAATRQLRTLAELQRPAAKQVSPAWGRQAELHWNELAEPRQMIEDLARISKVKLAGGAVLIPYDLWGSGDLVGVSTGEALTVLAWQYDFQLRWDTSGKMSLVPLQLPVSVSRLYLIPEAKREAAKLQFPELSWKAEGKSLRVSGRVEELEALELWRTGGTVPRHKPKQPLGDWRTRKFNLQIKNAELIDVLKSLKNQGVPLDWNEAALVAAGVDLHVKLQINLTGASVEELLSALCQPAQLSFLIMESGATISASE